MKLEKLFISWYKNLENLEINFEENSSVNAFIGKNGVGKSNILEVIALIFSKLNSNKEISEFKFDICYSIYDSKFEVENLTSEKINVKKDGIKLAKKDFIKALPKAIFLYYCGETDRLRNISSNCEDVMFSKAIKNDDEFRMKFLSYITVKDFGIALISNVVYKTNTLKDICDLTEITNVLPIVKFKFKRPIWSKNGGVDTFWNARGAVNSAIQELINVSSLDNFKVIDKDNIEIVVPDIHNLAGRIHDATTMFIMLKMLMQADILEDVYFDVKKDERIFDYHFLSEGEKQLAQLLSIIELTREYKALFLLDEFDAYLHPNWQRKFTSLLNKIDIRGQVLITTHSPLTLGKMKKENVKFVESGKVYNLTVDTFNRDISEVMEEIMDVTKRPIEVKRIIEEFNKAYLRREKDKMINIEEKLKDLLAPDDPFFITMNTALRRLGDR